MCGIAGLFRPGGGPVERRVVRAMGERLAHRGPDDSAEYFDDAGGLGLRFRRLAILDLSEAGRQPMRDAERGLVLAFNGELYNFRELRARLETLGHRFRSSSDSEVVLAAFAEWGEAAFRRFAGMFALAVWDEVSRRLVLARDALGIKPLYLARKEGSVAFASEIKAFLELPAFRREVDPESLQQYLEFGYVFEPGRTIFSGAERLAPGEVVVLEGERLPRRFRHFEPPGPSEPEPVADRVDRLHATLGEVVRQHLVADVPVGLLLSGGIDSSLIAALAARSAPLTTVTMSFAESSIDERAPARRVAEHLGTRHLEVEIHPEEIESEVISAAWVFDDLFADWGTLSTRILYRKFRELGFKVALVGEGADELFGGYPIFAEAAEPATVWRRYRLYQRYASRRFGRLWRQFADALSAGGVDRSGTLFEAVRRFEVERQLPANYVMKVDKASMSESVEARAPFLDRRVAELALATPRELLLRGGENKWLLREVARRHNLLPPDVASRSKYGASVAFRWIDESPRFRGFARETILRDGSWCGRLGLRAPMERFFRGDPGYPFPHPLSILGHLVWRLLLLELWSESFLGPTPGAAAVPMEVPRAEIPTRGPDRIAGLVSTIIPVHNRPRLLVEAVESLLAQTYRPIEILIVDDGSSDETPRVAADLASRHPSEIRVLRRANGGPGLARETGRRAARGEFLQHLDSDDLLLPRKFELQVAALRGLPAASVAYGITQEIDESGRVEPLPERPSNVRIERMFPIFLTTRWWHTSAPLYRAASCDVIGPWTDLWLEEDWEYDCRVAALGAPVCFVPEVVAQHRNLDLQRLSRGAAIDARRLRHRARAHALILEHARRAGLRRESPEMRRYARELFLLARQCGAARLPAESEKLFRLARQASEPGRALGPDFLVYGAAARLLGWNVTGRVANWFDRLRFSEKGS